MQPSIFTILCDLATVFQNTDIRIDAELSPYCLCIQNAHMRVLEHGRRMDFVEQCGVLFIGLPCILRDLQSQCGATWTCASKQPKMSGQTWQSLWRLDKPSAIQFVIHSSGQIPYPC